MIKEKLTFPVWLYAIFGEDFGEIQRIQLLHITGVKTRATPIAYLFDIQIIAFKQPKKAPKIILNHASDKGSGYGTQGVNKNYTLVTKMPMPTKKKLFDNIFG